MIQKRYLNLWYRKDCLAPNPSFRQPLLETSETASLGGRFGYLLFFFRLGEGDGESEVPGVGAGFDFFIKIPGGGVSRRERGRGARRVSAANWRFFVFFFCF